MLKVKSLLVGLLVVVSLTGCGSQVNPGVPTPDPSPVVFELTWNPEYTARLQKEFQDNVEIVVDQDSPVQIQAGKKHVLLWKFSITNQLSKVAQLRGLSIDVKVRPASSKGDHAVALKDLTILVEDTMFDYEGPHQGAGIKTFSGVVAQSNNGREVVIKVFGDTTALRAGDGLSVGIIKNNLTAHIPEDGISFRFPAGSTYSQIEVI